jgi:hypothetical protein
MKDYLPVVATVGPIIAAIITLVVTRRWQKMKRVTFWAEPSEDLTLPIKESGQLVVVEIGQYRGFDLNRGVVTARNSGHAAIKDFTFQIRIPGEHELLLAEVGSEKKELAAAARITREQSGPLKVTFNPIFRVEVPFFNPEEIFEVILFFDKGVKRCEVSCRMEDVRCKIKRGKKRDHVQRLVGCNEVNGRTFIRLDRLREDWVVRHIRDKGRRSFTDEDRSKGRHVDMASRSRGQRRYSQMNSARSAQRKCNRRSVRRCRTLS